MSLIVLVLVTLIVAVVVVGRGGRDASRRPDPERYLAVHGLPPTAAGHLLVDRVLWRTRWFRILGAWCGFFVAFGWRLWHGSEGLIAGLPELTCALAGSLVGVAYAELRRPRRTRDGSVHSARLKPRDAQDYVDHRQERGRMVVAAVALGLLSYVAVRTDGDATRLAAVAVGCAVAALALMVRHVQRRIVERQQPMAPAALLVVDDALRATAVRVVHHAASGLLWCAVSFGAAMTLDVGGEEPTAVAVALVVFVTTAFVAAISEWRRARRAPFDDRVRPPARAESTGATA